MAYTFKITNAEIKGEEVVVYATFFSEKEKVKKIIHAFSRELKKEEIREEVGKALDLYVSELAQAKEQVKVDEATEQDRKLINSLIDK